MILQKKENQTFNSGVGKQTSFLVVLSPGATCCKEPSVVFSCECCLLGTFGTTCLLDEAELETAGEGSWSKSSKSSSEMSVNQSPMGSTFRCSFLSDPAICFRDLIVFILRWVFDSVFFFVGDRISHRSQSSAIFIRRGFRFCRTWTWTLQNEQIYFSQFVQKIFYTLSKFSLFLLGFIFPTLVLCSTRGENFPREITDYFSS